MQWIFWTLSGTTLNSLKEFREELIRLLISADLHLLDLLQVQLSIIWGIGHLEVINGTQLLLKQTEAYMVYLKASYSHSLAQVVTEITSLFKVLNLTMKQAKKEWKKQ
jgi:hypothetical protein